MGKERLIESAKEGLKSTKEFAKKRPLTVASSIGLSLSAFGLTSGAISRNIPIEIVGSVGVVLNVAVVVLDNTIRHKLDKVLTQSGNIGNQKA